MEEEFSVDLAKEIFIALLYVDKSLTDAIEDELLDKIVFLAADSNLNVEIDITKTLNEQNISEDCKDFIALLYYQNCDSLSRKGLEMIWSNNDN